MNRKRPDQSEEILDMGNTPDKVRPNRADHNEEPCTVEDLEQAIRVLEGRWKLVILFRLFEHGTLRFSQLEQLIPTVTQKMLIQQLRALEADRIVSRTTYPVVPPHVEYSLSPQGRALKPALEALRDWSLQQAPSRPEQRSASAPGE